MTIVVFFVLLPLYYLVLGGIAAAIIAASVKACILAYWSGKAAYEREVQQDEEESPCRRERGKRRTGETVVYH